MITGALGWRQAAQVLEVMGDVGVAEEEAAYELGATVAALLADGADPASGVHSLLDAIDATTALQDLRLSRHEADLLATEHAPILAGRPPSANPGAGVSLTRPTRGARGRSRRRATRSRRLGASVPADPGPGIADRVPVRV